MLLSSALIGFSCLALLFVFCFFVVIGVKSTIAFFRKFFHEPEKQPPKKAKPKPKPKNAKPIRSIEINPDEIDRIYVGKSR